MLWTCNNVIVFNDNPEPLISHYFAILRGGLVLGVRSQGDRSKMDMQIEIWLRLVGAMLLSCN